MFGPEFGSVDLACQAKSTGHWRHRVLLSAVDNRVSSLFVSVGGSNFFYECWTGGFDSDARHHGAAGIPDRTADRALREGSARGQQQGRENKTYPIREPSTHLPHPLRNPLSLSREPAGLLPGG